MNFNLKLIYYIKRKMEIVQLEKELVQKLKENFTESEQQMFVQSFSMYLNHDQESEYIINLDDIYNWIGFTRKMDCKKLLLKYFEEHKDYKIIDSSSEEELATADAVASSSSIKKEKIHGGQNKETIMLNIKTFKKLCMKASTKKADSIHDYYIKMEFVLHQYIKEKMDIEKKQIKETTLLESYDNKKVLYLLWINEFLLKFGWSDNINKRLLDHKITYGNQSKLIYVTECSQNKLLETHMKQHNDINSAIISKIFNKRNRTELIDITKITISQIIKIIEFLKDKLLQDFEIFQMEHLERMKDLDNIKYKEITKQKEIEFKQKEKEQEYNHILELKKLEYESKKLDLEIRKLEIQQSQPIQQPIQQSQIIETIIIEFFNTCTVFSTNNSDTIKMTVFYSKFIKWIKTKYPNVGYPPNKLFTQKFNKLKIGIYKNSITNLNGTSGLLNRKFIFV